MTKPTSTREEHERIIPYSGHNSNPIRSQEDWNDSMLLRGDGDPDYFPVEQYICDHLDYRLRPMVGYEDMYIVTANGKIFSKTRTERAFKNSIRTRKGKWLKESRDRPGKYNKVEITNRVQIAAHRAIAMAFIPNPDNKPFINHIDSEPSHNCVSNLEWCTQSENIQHSFDYGNAPHGANKPGAKLNWSKVDQIRTKLKNGSTLNSLAGEYGVSKRLVLFIKQNKAWTIRDKPQRYERVNKPFIPYRFEPDEVSNKPLEMLPFMQAIGGDSEPVKPEPVYEEASDIA